eukprot:Em0015g391a
MALKQRFEPDSKKQLYMAELHTQERHRDEDWASYGDALRVLADKAYSDLEEKARERLALTQFLAYIGNPQVAFGVRQKRPKTMEAAVVATIELDVASFSVHGMIGSIPLELLVDTDKNTTKNMESVGLVTMEKILVPSESEMELMVKAAGSVTEAPGKRKIEGVSSVDQETLWSLVSKAGKHLNTQEKEQLFLLLQEYADVFSFRSSDLGRTSVLQHRINTGTENPIHVPPRCIPQARKEEVHRLLHDMLENGIVEPSKGRWSSPIVLAKKKDGSLRFCVDYRKDPSTSQCWTSPVGTGKLKWLLKTDRRQPLQPQRDSTNLRQFESLLLKEVCNLLQIKKTHTTPYRPQGNGMVERFNRTLPDMLATAVGDWEIHIRYSQFFPMFGRQATIPVDLMYSLNQGQEKELPSYAHQLREGLKEAYALVRNHCESEHQLQKAIYDRKVHGKPFSIGNMVWLFSPAVPRGRCKKFHHPWKGPFIVVEKKGAARTRLRTEMMTKSEVRTMTHIPLTWGKEVPVPLEQHPSLLVFLTCCVAIQPENPAPRIVMVHSLNTRKKGEQCNELVNPITGLHSSLASADYSRTVSPTGHVTCLYI